MIRALVCEETSDLWRCLNLGWWAVEHDSMIRFYVLKMREEKLEQVDFILMRRTLFRISLLFWLVIFFFFFQFSSEKEWMRLCWLDTRDCFPQTRLVFIQVSFSRHLNVLSCSRSAPKCKHISSTHRHTHIYSQLKWMETKRWYIFVQIENWKFVKSLTYKYCRKPTLNVYLFFTSITGKNTHKHETNTNTNTLMFNLKDSFACLSFSFLSSVVGHSRDGRNTCIAHKKEINFWHCHLFRSSKLNNIKSARRTKSESPCVQMRNGQRPKFDLYKLNIFMWPLYFWWNLNIVCYSALVFAYWLSNWWTKIEIEKQKIRFEIWTWVCESGNDDTFAGEDCEFEWSHKYSQLMCRTIKSIFSLLARMF